MACLCKGGRRLGAQRCADWNVISRTIMPVISQPNPIFGSNTNGIGDITQEFFLTPTHPATLIWGVGPVFTIPSATDPILGTGRVLAGGIGSAVDRSDWRRSWPDIQNRRPARERLCLRLLQRRPSNWHAKLATLTAVPGKVMSANEVAHQGAGKREGAALQRAGSVGHRARRQRRRRPGRSGPLAGFPDPAATGRALEGSAAFVEHFDIERLQVRLKQTERFWSIPGIVPHLCDSIR